MTETSSQTKFGGGDILLSQANSIATITFNKPETANGMTVPFLLALYEAVMTVHGDPNIRVLVLKGAGRHFCAGGDVKDFASKGEALPDYLRQATSYLANISGALTHLKVPVIASVKGFAAGGGGFGLVCASDFVVAARSSKFLTGATRAGMAPDAGATVTLQKLVGFRRAMSLFMLNNPLDAQAALDMGLITSVVDDEALEAETLALAQTLAEGAPLAIAETKRMLWAGMGSNMDSCLPEESRVVSALSGTEDAREALAAVIEKRKAVFKGQ